MRGYISWKIKTWSFFPLHELFLLLHHLCVCWWIKKKGSFSMPNNQAFVYVMYILSLPFAEKLKIERKWEPSYGNKKIIEFCWFHKIKYIFLETFYSLQKLSQWRHKSWFQWFIYKFVDNKKKRETNLISHKFLLCEI